jgi:hypothetical protein
MESIPKPGIIALFGQSHPKYETISGGRKRKDIPIKTTYKHIYKMHLPFKRIILSFVPEICAPLELAHFTEKPKSPNFEHSQDPTSSICEYRLSLSEPGVYQIGHYGGMMEICHL